MLAFSVGCMTFETHDDPEITESGWKTKVERALSQIPSVSNVRITASDLDHRGFEALEEQNFSFEHGWQCGNFRPQPSQGAVSFELRIPQHLQNELHPQGASRAGSETFAVSTVYTSYMPVTIVVGRGAKGGSDPQHGFVVVREFLKKELTLRGEGVSVGIIGPSPAWSDCFLEPGTTPSGEPFAIDYAPGGYEHRFRYDPAAFATEGEAAVALFDILAHELRFYYEQETRRNRRMFRVLQIERGINDLIAVHSKRGVRAAISRNFKSGTLERKVSLQIFSAMLAEQEDGRGAAETAERIYAVNRLAAFRYFVDRVIGESYGANLEHARRIVEMLGSRRTKEFEIATIASSTLLGGVAGAVAALLAAT